MLRRYSLLTLALMWVGLSAAADSISAGRIDYVPKFGGVMRARWEMNTDGGLNRFMLRNARVNVAGRIAAPVDYYIQADLCDRGKMKFLDGWIRLALFDGFRFQAGQFRMPFGIDTFRGPGNYIFANRSFIGRQMCNYRAVGVKASYRLPRIPVEVEAGVFNPGTITDHTSWTHGKACAGKVTATAGDFRFSAGYMSIIPDSVRINMADAAVVYERAGWHAEAEYIYKHYTSSRYTPGHGMVVFVDYSMPVRAGIFNRCSFQARFDAMTDHSSGVRDDSGALVTDDPARRRVTVGATISRIMGLHHAGLRLNYEKYFYNRGVTPPVEGADKIVAELVLKF